MYVCQNFNDNKYMKSLVKGSILLIILASSILLSAFIWLNRPTDNIPVDSVEFEIVKGDSSHSVANRLYASGYINSKILFLSLVRILNIDRNLKTGWVKLQRNSTTTDIIRILYSGNSFITVSFTVPEGSSLSQIKAILENDKILNEDQLNTFFSSDDYTSKIGLSGFKSAEGFLFPETYKFYKGASPEKIFSTMVKLAFSKIGSVYPNYKNLTKKELINKITMASIIEKEVKLKDEAELVSGVFYNRLKSRMKLQSCATVQYVLEKPKEQLLEDDLLIDSPYNTYIYQGLPPGPICSPGYNAIKAAFYPAEHDYLFFVVKDPSIGSHHFSVTYQEHLNAQKEYKHLKGFY